MAEGSGLGTIVVLVLVIGAALLFLPALGDFLIPPAPPSPSTVPFRIELFDNTTNQFACIDPPDDTDISIVTPAGNKAFTVDWFQWSLITLGDYRLSDYRLVADVGDPVNITVTFAQELPPVVVSYSRTLGYSGQSLSAEVNICTP